MENITLVTALMVWITNGIIWSIRIFASWRLHKPAPIWAHIVAAISVVSACVLLLRMMFGNDVSLTVYLLWALMGCIVFVVSIKGGKQNVKNQH